jgi:hypothetical protein
MNRESLPLIRASRDCLPSSGRDSAKTGTASSIAPASSFLGDLVADIVIGAAFISWRCGFGGACCR